mmetsp:Transcript_58983/g.182869  ORF Transcript_58983/g.182869 Transcript_58983/m.182869 type:complete len:210 (-) Transcript_58983:637-1266(-)
MLSHAPSVTATEQRVHLVEEDDGWRRLLHQLLKCLDSALGLAVELGHHIAWAHVKERGVLCKLSSSRACKHRLATTRWPVEQEPTWAAPDTAEERGVGNCWPDDGLAERALGSIQANHVVECGTSPRAADIHACPLKLYLQLSKAVITITVAAQVLTLFVIVGDVWARPHHASFSATPRGSDPHLVQFTLEPRRQLPLLLQFPAHSRQL